MSLTDLKDTIKELNISRVIEAYVPLTKRGQLFYARCPWHNDQNPSLTVTDSKGLYRCWSCDIGGDAISFVQRYLGLDFKESLVDIAKRIGLPYEELEKKKKDPQRLLGEKVSQKAAELYYRLGQRGDSQVFQDFLKKRKLNQSSIDQFMIGFAPGENALAQYLRSIPSKSEQVKAIEMALTLGLIKEDRKRQNAYFDTFRERVVFPLFDLYGQVVGITGRATKESQRAKYLNSPESFLFRKKNLLYGLHLAKSAIKSHNKIILVEGQMDCVQLHQHGQNYTAAISGTALGEWPLKTMLSLTKNIYFALDSDQAGLKAMERLNQLFLEQKVFTRHISLAPYKDPDELLNDKGQEDWIRREDEASPLIDTQLDKLINPEIVKNSTTEQRVALLDMAFEKLSPLGNDLSAKERVIGVAKTLGFQSSSQDIVTAYEQFLKNLRDKRPKSQSLVTQLVEKTQNSPPTPQALSEQEKPLPKAYVQLIQGVILRPELFEEQNLTELLDFITDNEVKRCVDFLRNLYFEVEESEFLELVKHSFSHENWSLSLRDAVSSFFWQNSDFSLTQDERSKTSQKFLEDMKRGLQLNALKQKRDQLKNTDQSEFDSNRIKDFFSQMMELEKKINSLKSGQNIEKDLNS